MSIRTVLVVGMLLVAFIPTTLVSAIGVYSISTSVRKEAQSRVNQDLQIVVSAFDDQLALLAKSIETVAERVAPNRPNLAEILASIKHDLDLTVLNLCDSQGKIIAGTYPSQDEKVPLGHDPVLRNALQGKTAWGTVILDPARLYFEGGPALQHAAAVFAGESDLDPTTRSGLLWWIACPITDDKGRVVALLYGGRMLNFNYPLVDKLRETVFSEKDYRGKPRGTVTIFLNDVRVATNVLAHDGSRAIGTVVSDVVKRTVLQLAQNYTGDAWVVDAWYLSAYSPLRDPAGKTIGMIYVGLLEAPYGDLRVTLITRFLVPVFAVCVLAVLGALVIVNRITRPVKCLSQAALGLAAGNGQNEMVIPQSYSEIRDLAGAFAEMQTAIHKRDQQLRARNAELAETNEKLAQTNSNYMKTLGFVTHELKSPLAAIQSIIGTVVGGYVGDVPEKVGEFLIRIQRNCEELQDMVKNYLDLSRAERGELVARKRALDLRCDVLEPCVDQTATLFKSRDIMLSVDCPEALPILGDPELLRIALTNYLTNAAKYGREGGTAKVTARREDGALIVGVWNEGAGFTAEEQPQLFGKFSRLANDNTRSKRGSGLGLFLVKSILSLHAGRVWAESQPGTWAAFYMSFPSKNNLS
jgi:two-component system, NtrC family, sensor kinase